MISHAGLKAVGESVRLPMQYYHNNLTGTLHLVELLSKYGCKTIVFSSSATVYGQPEKVPATEDLSLGATNPYGRTKLYIEQILRDVYASDSSWSIALLRYFNPVGAHPSGLIGEDPKGIPNNLMPFVQQVWYRWLIPLHRRGHTVTTHFCVGCCWAAGMLERFWRRLPNKGWYRCSRLHSCHGFSRRAYSCARHYVKVEDGLWVWLMFIERTGTNLTPQGLCRCRAINLGTGKGTSVLEIVEAFRAASGQAIPIKIVSRRAGDVAEVYGATDKAREELGWVAKRGIEEMCRDQWNWASKNPDGYEG
eukprot:scaffold7214_cov410-Prasinococcus_capsulatus_cf.AAC.20